MASSLKERLRPWRPFSMVLLCTLVVWLLISMSDVKDYPARYHVTWMGVDTARYVVTQCDTVLEVTLRNNGFTALQRSLNKDCMQLFVQANQATLVHKDSLAVLSVDVAGCVRKNLQTYHQEGTTTFTTAQDSLQLHLSERYARPYVPDISKVVFDFMPQFGMEGVPVLQPDTVWLYGSKASLARIPELHVMPTTLPHIGKSGYHRLQLDSTSWAAYADVRPGVRYVNIYIPVQRFVEKVVHLPLQVQGVDTTQVRMRLYPIAVDVTVWVPATDYTSLNEKDFAAIVKYGETAQNGRMKVYLSQFPAQVRIKEITPATVQYVIIK